MFFGKSESRVKTLMLEHAQLVKKSLESVIIVVDVFFTKPEELEDSTYETHRLEHEADVSRRDIQAELAGGAFLPFYREEYISLADQVDKIANCAVDFAKPLCLEKPAIPGALAPRFQELAKWNLTALESFIELLNVLFDDPSKVQELAEKVSAAEQESDSCEWKLKKALYENASIDRAEKVIIEKTITRLASIADATENAADITRIIVAKQS